MQVLTGHVSGYACATRRPTPHHEETDMSDGSADKLKGRGKEAAGDLTGNQDLKDEGKVDRTSGKLKGAVGGAADKIKNALRKD